MLRTENIIKRYKRRTVVGGVSVQVQQGEIVGLLGPNGAGKTTTFYTIVGLIKPNEGRVLLDDMDITDLAMYKRAKQGIGYLPQEASVFRKLSVEDNIRAILEMTGKTRREQDMKVEQLLEEFSLTHVRKNMGDVLSGGERRRTEIARALANEPRFILLDEPFAGVDPIAVQDIQAILRRLRQERSPGPTAIAISALSEAEARGLHGLPADVPLLTKPVDPRRLHALLRAAVDARTSGAQRDTARRLGVAQPAA